MFVMLSPRGSFDACPVEYTVGQFVGLLWSLQPLSMSNYPFFEVSAWSLAFRTIGRPPGMLLIAPLSFCFSTGCLWWSWGHKCRRRICIDYLCLTFKGISCLVAGNESICFLYCHENQVCCCVTGFLNGNIDCIVDDRTSVWRFDWFFRSASIGLELGWLDPFSNLF